MPTVHFLIPSGRLLGSNNASNLNNTGSNTSEALALSIYLMKLRVRSLSFTSHLVVLLIRIASETSAGGETLSDIANLRRCSQLR